MLLGQAEPVQGSSGMAEGLPGRQNGRKTTKPGAPPPRPWPGMGAVPEHGSRPQSCLSAAAAWPAAKNQKTAPPTRSVLPTARMPGPKSTATTAATSSSSHLQRPRPTHNPRPRRTSTTDGPRTVHPLFMRGLSARSHKVSDAVARPAARPRGSTEHYTDTAGMLPARVWLSVRVQRARGRGERDGALCDVAPHSTPHATSLPKGCTHCPLQSSDNAHNTAPPRTETAVQQCSVHQCTLPRVCRIGLASGRPRHPTPRVHRYKGKRLTVSGAGRGPAGLVALLLVVGLVGAQTDSLPEGLFCIRARSRVRPDRPARSETKSLSSGVVEGETLFAESNARRPQ